MKPEHHRHRHSAGQFDVGSEKILFHSDHQTDLVNAFDVFEIPVVNLHVPERSRGNGRSVIPSVEPVDKVGFSVLDIRVFIKSPDRLVNSYTSQFQAETRFSVRGEFAVCVCTA